MVRQQDWFDEFEDYLSGEPVPEIDLIKNREEIYKKLENRSKIFKAGSHKKRLLLVAAIAVSLAAYPVYAVTYSIFKEFRTSNERISVKFGTETDEIKKLKEDKFAADEYMNEKYQEVFQERINALDPGEAEVIIARSPDGSREKFLKYVIIKNDYINQFDQFTSRLKDAGEFAQLEPVLELPGGFIFDKGEFVYQRDFYTEEDEMEDLMTKSEENGASYAVKSVNKSDQIEAVYMKYINKTDSDTTLSIRVQHSSRDTYIVPDESMVEKISYNEDEILTHTLQSKNGDMRAYSLLKKDLLFMFTFSKDMDKDAAIEIIDVF